MGMRYCIYLNYLTASPENPCTSLARYLAFRAREFHSDQQNPGPISDVAAVEGRTYLELLDEPPICMVIEIVRVRHQI